VSRRPLAVVTQRDILRFHLVVRTVGAVGLRHCLYQHSAGYRERVAGQQVRTGAAGRTRVRVTRIVHVEFDLARLDAQRPQRLIGKAEGTEVRPLTVILPGVIDHHVAIGEQFCRRLGTVRTIQPGAVHAQRETDAISLARHVVSCLALLRFFPLGLDQFEQPFHAVHFRFLTGRRGMALAFLVAIPQPQLERIDAHLFGQHIYGDFLVEERLRGAVGAESRSPGVVGRNRVALGTDVRNTVTGAHKLRLAQGEEVAEFGIRAVIHPPFIIQRDQLAVLIRAPLGLDFSR